LARRQAALLSLAGVTLLLAAAAALAATGDLSQPARPNGCVSETGSGGDCTDGHLLSGAHGVAVSPDGKSVYVAIFQSNGGVSILNRDTTTGAITQPAGTAGCVSETGAGPCADGHGLKLTNEVAVSPDGKNLYVASTGSDAVARLNRDTTTGAISQPAGTAGCVSETGAGTCANGHGLDFPLGVAVSPDGKSVYVASAGTSAVARFNRNTTTGAITQPAGALGCVSDTGGGSCANGHGLTGARSVAVSPDGKSVYVASSDGFVARLNRNTTTGAITQPAGTTGCVSENGGGTCANGHGLNTPLGVAVSPDGKSVYVGSADSDAVARFNRNATTGAITQPAGTAGCVSNMGAGLCAAGHGLDGADQVAVSADGKNVYVTSNGGSADQGGAVARLDRNTTTGAITQPSGHTGCRSVDGSGNCARGRGLQGAIGVAVSPDGKSVYVGSDAGAVAHFIRAP
jgi:DNA-binding beta-propeller fold protein YncE